jgi:hypothetical protein
MISDSCSKRHSALMLYSYWHFLSRHLLMKTWQLSSKVINGNTFLDIFVLSGCQFYRPIFISIVSISYIYYNWKCWENATISGLIHTIRKYTFRYQPVERNHSNVVQSSTKAHISQSLFLIKQLAKEFFPRGKAFRNWNIYI